jgi:hypothetical protein
MRSAAVDHPRPGVEPNRRRRRRRRHLASLIALAVTVFVACAGCRLDVGVDITMAADGTGRVTVTAVADPQLVVAAPSAFADLRLDDIRQAGWTVTGPTKNADGSMTMTLVKPFATPAEATTILVELNGPDGPLQGLAVGLDRSFALVASTLAGHTQVTGGVGAFSDAALVQALGSPPLANVVTQPVDQVLGLTVTAGFAGTVTTADGQIAPDRQSVQWTPSLADGVSTPINARFELVDQGARDARRTSHLAWGALGIYLGALVLIVLVISFLIRLRRRRRARRAQNSPSL